jgi:heme/copper-type cytochrome/quinol oxidase subunit 2
MAEQEDTKGLPATWPFLVAAVAVMVALVLFCGHYAIRDPQADPPKAGLSGFTTIFWTLIVGAIVLIVGGAAYNIYNRHRRRRQPA